ncbi:MAG: septum formation inhibitor Maf [Clostridia bacterium]|nr:septum formation inhibitor Maf [Clostridia bacterium]
MMKSFILASNSPRRKELLHNCGYSFEVKPSDCDENTDGSLTPQETVKELARRKAMAVLAENADSVVLGCDTVVALEGEILGKPQDREDAYRMLTALSGKKHIVVSGVCVADKNRCECFENTTEVEFNSLSEETVNSYLDTLEYTDKAGGYGIQGFGSVLVKGIRGDYFSVMGLPVSQCAALLSSFGIYGKVRI